MKRSSGFTYIELVIATFILAILTAAIVPVAEVTAKRAKEVELRRNLRTLRDAIDNYKQSVDLGLIGGSDIQLGSEGYPPESGDSRRRSQPGGCSGQEAEVLEANPLRPHDAHHRMGASVVPGRAGLQILGRSKRL